MNIKTQRYLGLVLSALNIAGIVGTFIFVAKETPKYNIEKSKLEKDASKAKKVKTFIKNYKMSLIFAGASIASGIGSKVLSTKTEASLLATIGMLSAASNKYKDKIQKTFNNIVDKEDAIREFIDENYEKPTEKPMNGEELFKEEHIGYFYAKPEKLYKVMNRFNDELAGEVNYFGTGADTPKEFTLGELLRCCGARPLSHTLDNTRLNFGWSWEYLSYKWDAVKIHWDIDQYSDEDGARLITFYEDPIWNPSDWESHRDGSLTSEEYFDGINPKYVNINDGLYSIE